jgi:hypothetical protein
LNIFILLYFGICAMSCLAITLTTGQRCQTNPLKDMRFCGHHKYLEVYTDDELKLLILCKKCNKSFYSASNQTFCSACPQCPVILINDVGVSTRCQNICGANLPHCNKHTSAYFRMMTENSGQKVCTQHIRGCRTVLPMDYAKSRCEVCLAKDREKDHQKRQTAKDLRTQQETEMALTGDIPDFLICTIDGQLKPYHEFYHEINDSFTNTCLQCRNTNKTADLNRPDRNINNREYSRKYEQTPERKQKKALWKYENYDKIVRTWKASRARQIHKLGIDGYRKKNAEYAKQYRDDHPEMVEPNNTLKRMTPKIIFQNYFHRALMNGIPFELKLDEVEQFIRHPCFYCKRKADDIQLNGIDRLNNNTGYVLTNCVSCCEMCNFLKTSLDPTVFIMRIEHILTNLKIISGTLSPELFPDTLPSTYIIYKNNATVKNIEFGLSEHEYHHLTQQSCYICNKLVSTTHQSGIDRFDSKKGYEISNCRSCCYECNIMKNNYDYDQFINKIKLIHETCCDNSVVEHLNAYMKDVMGITTDIDIRNANDILSLPNVIKTNKIKKSCFTKISNEQYQKIKDERNDALIFKLTDAHTVNQCAQKLAQIRHETKERPLVPMSAKIKLKPSIFIK